MNLAVFAAWRTATSSRFSEGVRVCWLGFMQQADKQQCLLEDHRLTLV
jgi:hypothetical protein